MTAWVWCSPLRRLRSRDALGRGSLVETAQKALWRKTRSRALSPPWARRHAFDSPDRRMTGEFATTHDLGAQRDHGFVVGQDRTQGSGADQLGDGARIARVRLALAAGKAFGQENRLREAGQRSGDVEPDHDRAAQGAQILGETVDRRRIVLDRAIEENLRGTIEQPAVDPRSARRAAQPLEPSRTAGMTTMHASPAPGPHAAFMGASNKGKAE